MVIINREELAVFASDRRLPQPATPEEFYSLMQVMLLDKLSQSVKDMVDAMAVQSEPSDLVELREPEEATTAPKRSSRRKKSEE